MENAQNGGKIKEIPIPNLSNATLASSVSSDRAKIPTTSDEAGHPTTATTVELTKE